MKLRAILAEAAWQLALEHITPSQPAFNRCSTGSSGPELPGKATRLLGEYPRRLLPDVATGFNVEREILLNLAPGY